MNDASKSSRLNTILSFLPPIRIVTILSILVLFPGFKLSWQFSIIIFYGFFFFIIGSFLFEWILIAKLKEFRKEFWPLYNEYAASLPFEFLGVFIFVAYSFTPDTNFINWSEVRFAAIPLGGGIILEVLHRYVFTRLKNKKLTGVKEILSIISLTVILFFLGLYANLVIFQHVSLTLWIIY